MNLSSIKSVSGSTLTSPLRLCAPTMAPTCTSSSSPAPANETAASSPALLTARSPLDPIRTGATRVFRALRAAAFEHPTPPAVAVRIVDASMIDADDRDAGRRECEIIERFNSLKTQPVRRVARRSVDEWRAKVDEKRTHVFTPPQAALRASREVG